jgi:hypothetical protein
MHRGISLGVQFNLPFDLRFFDVVFHFEKNRLLFRARWIFGEVRKLRAACSRLLIMLDFYMRFLLLITLYFALTANPKIGYAESSVIFLFFSGYVALQLMSDETHGPFQVNCYYSGC